MIWIQNQLVGASEGQTLTLECHSEAYPKSINYWTREKGEIIAHGNCFQLLNNLHVNRPALGFSWQWNNLLSYQEYFNISSFFYFDNFL